MEPPNYYQTTQVTQPKTKGPDYQSTTNRVQGNIGRIGLGIDIGIKRNGMERKRTLDL